MELRDVLRLIEQGISRRNLRAAVAEAELACHEHPSLRPLTASYLALLGRYSDAARQLFEALREETLELERAELRIGLLHGADLLQRFVLAGEGSPAGLSPPPPYAGAHAAAMMLAAREENAQAAEVIRETRCPIPSGTLSLRSGETIAFDEIGDVAPLGRPVLPVIIPKSFLWIPYEDLRSLSLGDPEDTFDQVLRPAQAQVAMPSSEPREGAFWVPMVYESRPSRRDDATTEERGVILEERPGGLELASGWRSLRLLVDGERRIIPLHAVRRIEIREPA